MSKWLGWLFWGSILFVCSYVVAGGQFQDDIGDIPLDALVMVDSVKGTRRSSAPTSEFLWASLSSPPSIIVSSKAASKNDPSWFDYEFVIEYYPASCDHTVFLNDALGSERVGLRLVDSSITIIDDSFSSFNTSYLVAHRLVKLYMVGARVRW